MKISKNFDIRELVPKNIWDSFGTRSVWFLDPKMVDMLQEFRDILEELYPGRVFVIANNWHTGGQRDSSGFRPPNDVTGKPFSQHRYGRAVDVQVFVRNDSKNTQLTSQQVAKIIFDNEKRLMAKGLTTIEDPKITRGWNHLDVRNTGMDKILVVGA